MDRQPKIQGFSPALDRAAPPQAEMILSMERIRLLLADDHVVVRQGFRTLLETESDLVVIGEAENGRQAVRMAMDLLPDIVIMDIAMPLLNGLEATRQITRAVPSARVLMLSAYDHPGYVGQSAKAGAAGYLPKQAAVTELIRAIREMKNGNAGFRLTVSPCRLDQGHGVQAKASGHGKSLTARESEVLQLIAEGAPNKQIAAELCISIKTVEKHRQQVMNKLNIHHIAGLTRFALCQGVIELPQFEDRR